MSTRQRLHEIDYLRGIACLAVVAFHYLSRGPRAGWMEDALYPGLEAIARYGYLGVHLFFIISGFVILYSAQEASPRSFFASRAARLYPAFWVAATLTAVIVWLSGDSRFAVSPAHYMLNLTMFPHWFGVPYVDGAYWSLACELHFYIGVWLVLRCGLLHRIEWLLAAWLMVSLINAVRPMWPMEFWLNAKWAPLFAAGCIFFLIRRGGLNRARGALLAFAYGLALHYAVVEAHSASNIHSPAIVIGIVSSFFAVCLYGALRPPQGLAWPGASLIGALTYPLYVLHQNMGYVLYEKARSLSGHPVLSLLGVTLLILFLAWLIHRAIEIPLGPRLRRLLSASPTLKPQGAA